ncbi:hypothetical protein YC2023_051699 [Brassica napus]
MSTFSGDETAPFFGFLGAAAALVFSCKSFLCFISVLFLKCFDALVCACCSHVVSKEKILVSLDKLTVLLSMGAAYGTAKSGVGVASMGVMRPELVMKSIVPVVMAGVLGIYEERMLLIRATLQGLAWMDMHSHYGETMQMFKDSGWRKTQVKMACQVVYVIVSMFCIFISFL